MPSHGERSRWVRCRAARLVAWAGAVAGLAGCGGGDDRVAVYPVRGAVQVGAERPEGALVVLHPAGVDPAGLRPSGRVGADGSFRLTTYDADDGAPAGDYVATIQWNKLIKRNGEMTAGPNAVPAAYATPDASPWKIHVDPKPNDLPPRAIEK